MDLESGPGALYLEPRVWTWSVESRLEPWSPDWVVQTWSLNLEPAVQTWNLGSGLRELESRFEVWIWSPYPAPRVWAWSPYLEPRGPDLGTWGLDLETLGLD